MKTSVSRKEMKREHNMQTDQIQSGPGESGIHFYQFIVQVESGSCSWTSIKKDPLSKGPS